MTFDLLRRINRAPCVTCCLRLLGKDAVELNGVRAIVLVLFIMVLSAVVALCRTPI